MRIFLRAAFAVASALLAGVSVSHAQSAPAEEELLGGPGAPITLRSYAPPPAQPAPKKPKPVIAQKPVVAQKKSKIVVAEKPKPTKPVAAPRLAAAKPAAPAPKPTPKIAAVEPGSVPREPPIIRYEQKQAATLATPLEESPTLLAGRDEPPDSVLEDKEQATAREEIAPVPDQQFAQIDRLIERAVRRGDIRPRTADALHDDLLDIADMQDELVSDGALRAADRDLVSARLERLREHINDAAQSGPDWR